MPVHTVGGLFLADLVVALLARSDARDGAGLAGEPNLHIAGLSPGVDTRRYLTRGCCADLSPVRRRSVCGPTGAACKRCATPAS